MEGTVELEITERKEQTRDYGKAQHGNHMVEGKNYTLSSGLYKHPSPSTKKNKNVKNKYRKIS